MWVVDASSKKPEAILQGSHLRKMWILRQEVELRGGLEDGWEERVDLALSTWSCVF